MEILIRPKALKFLFCIFETKVSKIGKKKKAVQSKNGYVSLPLPSVGLVYQRIFYFSYI